MAADGSSPDYAGGLMFTIISNSRPSLARILDAVDAERSAYLTMRQLVPDLCGPSAARGRLTARQSDAISCWQAAEGIVRALSGRASDGHAY